MVSEQAQRVAVVVCTAKRGRSRLASHHRAGSGHSRRRGRGAGWAVSNSVQQQGTRRGTHRQGGGRAQHAADSTQRQAAAGGRRRGSHLVAQLDLRSLEGHRIICVEGVRSREQHKEDDPKPPYVH